MHNLLCIQHFLFRQARLAILLTHRNKVRGAEPVNLVAIFMVGAAAFLKVRYMSFPLRCITKAFMSAGSATVCTVREEGLIVCTCAWGRCQLF